MNARATNGHVVTKTNSLSFIFVLKLPMVLFFHVRARLTLNRPALLSCSDAHVSPNTLGLSPKRVENDVSSVIFFQGISFVAPRCFKIATSSDLMSTSLFRVGFVFKLLYKRLHAPESRACPCWITMISFTLSQNPYGYLIVPSRSSP